MRGIAIAPPGAPADAKAITRLLPRRDNRRDRDVAGDHDGRVGTATKSTCQGRVAAATECSRVAGRSNGLLARRLLSEVGCAGQKHGLCLMCLVLLSDRPDNQDMSLSRRDRERLGADIVARIDVERRERTRRRLAWLVAIVSLVLAAVAVAHGYGLM